MLISFSLENWMSFKDKATFSMVASRERQHGERVARLAKYRTRILPIAAIYGSNAAGKTNLFEALRFVEFMVSEGVGPEDPVPVETFCLDNETAKKPAHFSLELLVDGTIFNFSFSATPKAILEERLVKVTSSSEQVLYHRDKNQIDFHKSLPEKHRLQFVFEGTPNNQLYLSRSVFTKIADFRSVYDWFSENLVFIAPDTRLDPTVQALEQVDLFFASMNEALNLLDMGITRLGREEVPLDSLPVPKGAGTAFLSQLKEGMAFYAREDGNQGDYIILTRKDNRLVAEKLVCLHAKSDGTEVFFDLQEEPNSVCRVLDILPALLSLMSQNSQAVCVIDEIDRSLHTLLIRQLLTQYLSGCSSNTRTQLLMTTHDIHLMDQKLLRRDEIWVAERDGLGASSLIAFSEYQDIRYDKDIRKSYLQGRLGGIPRLP